MTDTTQPPAIFWDGHNVWMREDDGKVWDLTPHGYRDEPPADAVPLTPEDQPGALKRELLKSIRAGEERLGIITKQAAELSALRAENERLRGMKRENDHLAVQVSELRRLLAQARDTGTSVQPLLIDRLEGACMGTDMADVARKMLERWLAIGAAPNDWRQQLQGQCGGLALLAHILPGIVEPWLISTGLLTAKDTAHE